MIYLKHNKLTTTKGKTMKTIIDTNNHGDYHLVQTSDYSLQIVTSSGSILCQGSRDYVQHQWKSFKNT